MSDAKRQAGRPPLSDILRHGLPTYSPEIDELIREIDVLQGSNRTALADPEIQEILFKAETDSGLLERLRARLLQIRARLRDERV